MVEFKEDTICAIATPVGEGGIGIIKISGPETSAIARTLFFPHKPVHSLKSRHLYYGAVKDPGSGEVIDEVLLSYMAAPHTYTREDVVEINCHSGFAVLSHILELVVNAGARLAEPGEFTRRAFLNGRIDLSQAEAIVELIRSRSEQSLLLANRHLRGDFREKVQSWREKLLGLQAGIEASIDFEEDLTEDFKDEAGGTPALVAKLDAELMLPVAQALESYGRSRVLREGLNLVLAGKPNVGKSSMLNALVGKDRAIVTPFPGTTRDVIEDSFILSGILVRVLDTAGIRHQPDEIESFGIERTMRSVEEADIVLWIVDRSRPVDAEDEAVYRAVSSRQYVAVLNKDDLPAAFPIGEFEERFGRGAPLVALSALNPSDIDGLRNLLNENFLRQPLDRPGSAIIPNLRQKGCLERAFGSLSRVRELLLDGGYPELASVELQAARRELEAILGWNGDDDLLDRIFSEFCIGK